MKEYNVTICLTEEQNKEFLKLIEEHNKIMNVEVSPESFLMSNYQPFCGSARSFLDTFKFLLENTKNNKKI